MSVKSAKSTRLVALMLVLEATVLTVPTLAQQSVRSAEELVPVVDEYVRPFVLNHEFEGYILIQHEDRTEPVNDNGTLYGIN